MLSPSFPHMKCVVSNMVLPSLCLVSKSQVALLAYGSIPDVGSSSTTVLEPPIRAIPTLESDNIDLYRVEDMYKRDEKLMLKEHNVEKERGEGTRKEGRI